MCEEHGHLLVLTRWQPDRENETTKGHISPITSVIGKKDKTIINRRGKQDHGLTKRHQSKFQEALEEQGTKEQGSKGVPHKMCPQMFPCYPVLMAERAGVGVKSLGRRQESPRFSFLTACPAQYSQTVSSSSLNSLPC